VRTLSTKQVLKVTMNTEGGKMVQFIDGSDPVEADFVIGVDSIWSTTRKALFPNGKDKDPYPPHYE
jgi:2-polyprenyl-6-methoxyphenol hydroxylase-like FAD-dependent oxidoreductase